MRHHFLSEEEVMLVVLELPVSELLLPLSELLLPLSELLADEAGLSDLDSDEDSFLESPFLESPPFLPGPLALERA
jgi:hypothetical protein